MTRQMSFVIIIMAIIALLGLSVTANAQQSEHQWTSLDGPYWANGIDVAYGMSGLGESWHRYLIGTDGNVRKLFYWGELNPRWQEWAPLSAANKLISYKNAGSGHVSVCSAFDDDIYRTTNGGVEWTNLVFPETFNNRFSSVEIINTEQNPGNTIFVGCEPNASLATTYYTTDAGANWARLGGDDQTDPIYGLHIYDIESVQSSFLTAGTDDGLYSHDAGNYGSIWEYVAFDNFDVVALETVDLQDDEQMAAVVTDQGDRLFYTDDSWDTFQMIWIDHLPFDKEVRDIAGISWDYPGDPKSFHLATSDGLYLLKFEGNLQNIELYDLKDDPDFGYSPMQYDKNFNSVDYFFYEEGNYKHAKILASTPYNVYEIHETRDVTLILDIFLVEISEIVTGTYKCNVVGVSFPENTRDNKKIFTVTDNGLVKKMDDAAWKLMGLGFEPNGENWQGTDIATDFNGPDQDYVLVSSNTETNGTIMHSSDGGETWTVSFPDHWQMVGVDLEPGADHRNAYAADALGFVWLSEDDGRTWTDQWPLSTNLRGVTASTYDGVSTKAYAYGSGGPKVYQFDGNDWYTLGTGLESVEAVNQIVRCGGLWDFGPPSSFDLYAATTDGIYKYDGDTWSPRREGMPTVDLGTIVWDPNGFPPLYKDVFIEFLTATSNAITPPCLWASGDSGRSWIEFYRGDIDVENSINELAAPRAGPLEGMKSGFAAATDSGVYYIGDIFKQGYGGGYEEWGPGAVILNSDILFCNVSNIHEKTLTIVPPCTVIAVYDFDANTTPDYVDKAELIFMGNYRFEAIGDAEDDIIFTSSRPSGGTAGDWGGIEYEDFGFPSDPQPDLRLSYCLIEFAETGIHEYVYFSNNSMADTIVISNCKFRDNGTSGILLDDAEIRDSLHIENSVFENCGDYGIRIDDQFPNTSIWMTGNEITDCDYGIRYSGNQNPTYQNEITISGNTISRTTPEENTYGISLSKFDSQGEAPVSTIRSNSIANFEYGIHLNSLTDESVLWGNTVQNCSDYGLFLVSSSPSILMGPFSLQPNNFNENGIGIYCDANSNPHVRMTRIKNNDIGGVLIEPHDFTSGVPDFGTVSDWGNNSISYTLPAPPAYYDMKHQALSSEVPAERNWWGERDPIRLQIVGKVDYDPWLTEDPLAPHPKREAWYTNLPGAFGLRQNFPNPFNPITSISLYLAEPGFASLKIYNLNGQLVNTLVSDHMGSGEHTVIWDSKNSAGQEISSGIYFYILDTDYGKASKKMVLLR